MSNYQAVERDFRELFEIAREFGSGQLRSEGRNIACVHCDGIGRPGAGFPTSRHDEDCPPAASTTAVTRRSG